jgi:hypothetical protein
LHATAPIHKLIEKNTTYITFLRHPISCMLSTIYSGIRLENNQKIPERIKLENRIHWYLDNAFGLTKQNNRYFLLSRFFLSFYDDIWDNVNEWPPKNFEANGKYKDHTNKEILDLCNKIIDKHFKFIGITEKFDLSIFILSSLFNIEKIPNWEYLHVTGAPHYTELSNSILDRFTEILKVEIELYNAQLLKFNNMYEAYFSRYFGLIDKINYLNGKKKVTEHLE